MLEEACLVTRGDLHPGTVRVLDPEQRARPSALPPNGPNWLREHSSEQSQRLFWILPDGQVMLSESSSSNQATN